jgi:hypothetical protein
MRSALLPWNLVPASRPSGGTASTFGASLCSGAGAHGLNLAAFESPAVVARASLAGRANGGICRQLSRGSDCRH